LRENGSTSLTIGLGYLETGIGCKGPFKIDQGLIEGFFLQTYKTQVVEAKRTLGIRRNGSFKALSGLLDIASSQQCATQIVLHLFRVGRGFLLWN